MPSPDLASNSKSPPLQSFQRVEEFFDFFCKSERIARMDVQGRASQKGRGMDVSLAVTPILKNGGSAFKLSNRFLPKEISELRIGKTFDLVVEALVPSAWRGRQLAQPPPLPSVNATISANLVNDAGSMNVTHCKRRPCAPAWAAPFTLARLRRGNRRRSALVGVSSAHGHTQDRQRPAPVSWMRKSPRLCPRFALTLGDEPSGQFQTNNQKNYGRQIRFDDRTLCRSSKR